MKIRILILPFLLFSSYLAENAAGQASTTVISFDFYGDPIELNIENSMNVPFDSSLNENTIRAFYTSITQSGYESVVNSLLNYKCNYELDDWLYYQLIRKTAQQLSPKKDNYYRYTLYKWFLLNKSGYDATLSVSGAKLLFYVQSDEAIYNIPYHTKNGKQFICLNYHDYGGNIDFTKNEFIEVPIQFTNADKAFTYKVTKLPAFKKDSYLEKDVGFKYYQGSYHFKLKLNPQVQTIFANYPTVDYSYYFNIPLSKETYSSLIPSLKKNVEGMSKKNGIDFLMHFTRYAFLFEKDSKEFGQEKRMTAEETLLYDKSDCEDRAALFFYLVKEIYNLPMIVLNFPKHVTVAVNFDKPIGHSISYNGKKYSVCEPSPQKKNLKIGEILPELSKTPYEIAFEYNPGNMK